jgi:hypothetical protein
LVAWDDGGRLAFPPLGLPILPGMEKLSNCFGPAGWIRTHDSNNI